MNRAANFLFLFTLIAVGLSFAPIARAQSASGAGEIAALRQELRALAVRNQQQIEALQRQVSTLSAELAKSRSAPAAAAAPAPPARPPPSEPRPGGVVPRARRPQLAPES